MVDLLLMTGQSVPSGTRFTYKDMGDGTFALVVSAAIDSGESSIDANMQVGDVDVSNANPVPVAVIGTATISGNVTVINPLDDTTGSIISVDYSHHAKYTKAITLPMPAPKT